ncbi:hypothetical protein J6590_000630 [Homalodisca vitripennis]|nr:hypothetical protein J6590_000630 [Homalodisca vitripennis]
MTPCNSGIYKTIHNSLEWCLKDDKRGADSSDSIEKLMGPLSMTVTGTRTGHRSWSNLTASAQSLARCATTTSTNYTHQFGNPNSV